MITCAKQQQQQQQQKQDCSKYLNKGPQQKLFEVTLQTIHGKQR